MKSIIKIDSIILILLLFFFTILLNAEVVVPGSSNNICRLNFSNNGSLDIPDVIICVESCPVTWIEITSDEEIGLGDISPGNTVTANFYFTVNEDADDLYSICLKITAGSGDRWYMYYEVDCRAYRGIDIVICMDESGSMADPGGIGNIFSPSKYTFSNRASLSVFGLASNRPNDKIGALGFSAFFDDPEDEFPSSPATIIRYDPMQSQYSDTEWLHFYNEWWPHIGIVNSDDQYAQPNNTYLYRGILNCETNIGNALLQSQDMLNSAFEQSDFSRNILLTTDGLNNVENPSISFAVNQLCFYHPETSVYVIGFGYECEDEICSLIANSTDGLYRASFAGNYSNIVRYFYSIMTNQSQFCEIADYLNSYSDEQFFDVIVDNTCSQVTFSLQSTWTEDPEYSVPLEIITPDGMTINNDNFEDCNNVSFDDVKNLEIAQINNPTPGVWQIHILPEALEYYEIFVSGYTDKSLTSVIDVSEMIYGDIVHVSADLNDQQNPILNAVVSVEITKPDGEIDIISLLDDGMHGDILENDGIYSTDYLGPVVEYSWWVIPNYDFKIIATDNENNFSIYNLISVPFRDAISLEPQVIYDDIFVDEEYTIYTENPIYLTDDAKLIINETGSLTIEDDAIVYGVSEENKIIVYGNLNIGENVSFLSFEDDIWGGLHIIDNRDNIILNSPTFKNCKLTSENTKITIDRGEFINSNIVHCYKDLILNRVNFENGLVNATGSYPMHVEEILRINDCNFDNDINDNAIYATSFDNYEITADTIYTDGTAIFLNESGSGRNHLISDNLIKNNAEQIFGGFGIKLYNCYADIFGHNKIFNKLYGISGINSCQTQIVGECNFPFQEIHNNGNDEMMFTHDSFPYKFKYCIIFDDNHDDCYIKCGNHTGNQHFIYNDMQPGSAIPFDPDQDLFPSHAFDYEPMWDSGRNGELSEAEILFDQAHLYYDNEEHYQAEQIFKDVISVYPDSRFATASIRSLFSLEQYLDDNYEELKTYYLTEPNMSYNDDMINVSDFFANYCNLMLSNYSQVIDHYEYIIMNPPSIADSIFAVIDAGYTYLIMEGRDSYLGNIPELKPESGKDFEQKKEILLDLLFSELNAEYEHEEDIDSVILNNNYPNPFNPETTFSFSIPTDSNVNFSVYNIKGQKVKTLINKKHDKGLHKLIWNGKDTFGKEVSSGVYMYKLDVNGKTKSVKKCLLVK